MITTMIPTAVEGSTESGNFTVIPNKPAASNLQRHHSFASKCEDCELTRLQFVPLARSSCPPGNDLTLVLLMGGCQKAQARGKKRYHRIYTSGNLDWPLLAIHQLQDHHRTVLCALGASTCGNEMV